MSIGALLQHIAFGQFCNRQIARLTSLNLRFPAVFGAIRSRKTSRESKAEIIALKRGRSTRRTLDTLRRSFSPKRSLDPSGQHTQTRLNSLHSPKEHEMHHRGQLMLIERMLGITPHLTRQREERARQQTAVAAAS